MTNLTHKGCGGKVTMVGEYNFATQKLENLKPVCERCGAVKENEVENDNSN